MAYNLRIEVEADIKKIPSQRVRRKDIINIYRAMQDLYNSPIIIDPKGNYTTIKIPRVVKTQDQIPQVKSKLKQKKVNINGLSLVFGDGSGKATGGMNAVETAHQENATRVYCEHFIEKNHSPTFETIKKEYSKVDDDWMDSFEVTAQALKGYLGIGQRGYEYSREERGGIMTYLEKVAKDHCGVKTKDSWNKMDIVIVRKSKKDEIIEDIDLVEHCCENHAMALDALNEKMRYWGHTKDLIGISLKKVNPKRKIKTEWSDPRNVGKKVQPTINQNGIVFNWDFKSNDEFVTGELSFKIDVDGDTVTMQSRAFSGGKREKNQMDMTGAGASAKLGKISGPLAIDPFLHHNGLYRFEMRDMPKIGEWTDKDRKYWIDLFKSLKDKRLMGVPIEWGSSNTVDKWTTMLNKAIKVEQDIVRTASQLSSKLQSLYMLYNFCELEKKKLVSEFLGTCYYGAKGQYDSAGVFLKISD